MVVHPCPPSQAVLTSVIGNLFFRAGHLKPLSFLLDGATEALRQHVLHYSDMRRRAAEQHPDLFVALRDDALLERGRRRRGPSVKGSQNTVPSSGTGAATEELDDASACSHWRPSAVSHSGNFQTLSFSEIIAGERRWLEEQQERAIVAEYALSGKLAMPGAEAWVVISCCPSLRNAASCL